RPTSERVREALFAMLGEIASLKVLDVFAGAGGLGIEALSRGAARAVFIERDASALRALRANLDALGLGDERAQVRRADALAAVRETGSTSSRCCCPRCSSEGRASSSRATGARRCSWRCRSSVNGATATPRSGSTVSNDRAPEEHRRVPRLL